MKSLERISDFGALRTLLRVVIRGCQICSGEHEGTLVEKVARRVPIAGVGVDWALAWVMSPTPPCAAEAARLMGRTLRKPAEMCVTPLAVDEGRVFRIVDGDEKAEIAATAKPKRLERAR